MDRLTAISFDFGKGTATIDGGSFSVGELPQEWFKCEDCSKWSRVNDAVTFEKVCADIQQTCYESDDDFDEETGIELARLPRCVFSKFLHGAFRGPTPVKELVERLKILDRKMENEIFGGLEEGLVASESYDTVKVTQNIVENFVVRNLLQLVLKCKVESLHKTKNV